MPVDERVEAGFRRNADALRADPEGALAEILAKGRQQIRRRRAIRVIVAAAAVASLVALAPGLGRVLRIEPTITPGTSSTAPAPIMDPLGGTWRSSRTCADEQRVVAAAGLTADAARLGMRCHGDAVGTATFDKGWLELRGPKGALGWSGPYDVTGANTFVAGDQHFDEMYLLYRFTIQGNSLRVHLVRDDYPNPGPGRDGRTGDLIAQTIVWNSTPFERVS